MQFCVVLTFEHDFKRRSIGSRETPGQETASFQSVWPAGPTRGVAIIMRLIHDSAREVFGF